jgi:peptidyl-tRNA hydrolase, PTH2 family
MDSTGVKMVIVIRKDLNLRKGKMCAQASHAVMKIFLDRKIEKEPTNNTITIPLTDSMSAWLYNQFTKICVSVNSEQELLDIHKRAEDAGLPCSLIQDMGHTEFHGVPTYTSVAIGPDKADLIDPITGGLPLL